MENCPKCGSKLNKGDAFCRVCGNKIEDEAINNNDSIDYSQYEHHDIPNQNDSEVVNNEEPNNNIQANNSSIQSNNFNQINPNNSINSNGTNFVDDELVDAFIGKNVQDFKYGGFSWCSFWFGNIYFFYRKMWLLAFGLMILTIIVNIFLSGLANIVIIIIDLYISFNFKKMYFDHAKEMVLEIKKQNPNASKEQLVSICSKKGGTTIVPIILVIILYGVSLYLLSGSIRSQIQFFRVKQDDITEELQTSSKKIGDLSYSVPNDFQLVTEMDDYVTYTTNSNAGAMCVLTLKTDLSSNYKNDVEKYINYLIDTSLYKTSASTENLQINRKLIHDNLWYYVTLPTLVNNKYFYAFVYNRNIYGIDFYGVNDNSNYCGQAIETITSSLRFNNAK